MFNFLVAYLHVTHVLLLLSFINFPFEILVQSLFYAKSWRMYLYRVFSNSSFFLWINYKLNHLLSACLCSKQMIVVCVFDCLSYYFMYFNFWSNHSLTSAVHSSACQNSMHKGKLQREHVPQMEVLRDYPFKEPVWLLSLACRYNRVLTKLN